jgi:hypothetical protein
LLRLGALLQGGPLDGPRTPKICSPSGSQRWRANCGEIDEAVLASVAQPGFIV